MTWGAKQMILKIFLGLATLVLLIVIIILSKKLKKGLKEINAGQREYDANNNFFVRLFAGDQLAEGAWKLREGRKKHSRFSLLRTFLVLLLIILLILDVILNFFH